LNRWFNRAQEISLQQAFHRKSTRNRQDHQRTAKESAGFHPGRSGASLRTRRDSLQDVIAYCAATTSASTCSSPITARIDAAPHTIAGYDGPAGKLEALLEEPEDQAPNAAVLVCHPHPLHGDDAHKVCIGLRVVCEGRAVVLRFNYRGVNRSEGKYDDGRRKRGCTLGARSASLPISGLAFFARRLLLRITIVLKLGCEVSEVSRLIAVGFPAAIRIRATLAVATCPRLHLSTHDEFCPVPGWRPTLALDRSQGTHLDRSSDHFSRARWTSRGSSGRSPTRQLGSVPQFALKPVAARSLSG